MLMLQPRFVDIEINMFGRLISIFFFFKNLKEKDLEAVIQALCAFKDPQIDKAVNSLNEDELDVLTKYILKYTINFYCSFYVNL